jgi:hypothetical protein
MGPQIRDLMQDKQFDEDLNQTERNAWFSFKRICKDFLGSHKTAKYKNVIQDLLTSYKALRFNMSLKIHYMEAHLDFCQQISAKPSTNTVKDFTKALWLWKSGTKASGLQLCLTLKIYLKPNAGKNRMSLHFRRNFQPLSWARKVQF